MRNITVEITTKYHPEEVFDKVSSLLQSDRDLKRLDPDFSYDFCREKLAGSISSRHFKASMDIVAQGDGSRVIVTVKLPLRLALLRGPIQSKLEEKLNKLLM